MSVIDSPRPPAPVAPKSTSSRSNAVVIAVVVTVVAVLLIVPLLGIFLLRGNETTTVADSAETATISIDDSNAAAYAAFGEISVAAGSTIDTAVAPGEFIRKAGDIDILNLPGDGVEATIYDAADGVHLELVIANDMQSGVYAITFQLPGEPNPINWNFTVLPR